MTQLGPEVNWSTSAAKVGRDDQLGPWCSESISTVGTWSVSLIVSRSALLPAPDGPVIRMRRVVSGRGSSGPRNTDDNLSRIAWRLTTRDANSQIGKAQFAS